MRELIANWVVCTTATQGAGAITLGPAVDGYAPFSGVIADGAQVFYSLVTENGDREAGIGIYSQSANGLSRDTVQATLKGGLYSDTAPTPITLTGTSMVAVTWNAEMFQQIQTLVGTRQPLDPDLTAIAALAGDAGLLHTDGNGTWAVDASVYLTAEVDTLATVTGRGATTTTSVEINANSDTAAALKIAQAGNAHLFEAEAFVLDKGGHVVLDEGTF